MIFDTHAHYDDERFSEDADICVCTDLDEVFVSGWREKLESIWDKDTTRLAYNYNWLLDENNNPIERTNDTYKLYNDWKLHEKDGSSITYKEKEGVFPSQYAEGMVQCFSQGGITTNIVKVKVFK